MRRETVRWFFARIGVLLIHQGIERKLPPFTILKPVLMLLAETNHSNSDEENFPERDDLYFEELHACQNVFDVFRSSFTRQGSTSSHFSPRLLSHPSELLKRNKSSRNKRANFKLPQLLPLDVEVYHNIIGEYISSDYRFTPCHSGVVQPYEIFTIIVLAQWINRVNCPGHFAG